MTVPATRPLDELSTGKGSALTARSLAVAGSVAPVVAPAPQAPTFSLSQLQRLGSPEVQRVAAYSELERRAAAIYAGTPTLQQPLSLGQLLQGPPAAIVEQWRAVADRARGAGDAGALDRHWQDNRENLELLAAELKGGIDFDPETETGPDLYRPALAALAAQNPGAKLELLAVDLHQRELKGSGAGPLIAMTKDGVTRYFELNTRAIDDLVHSGQVFDALEQSGQVDAWYAALKASPGLQGVDRGSAQATLEFARSMGFGNAVLGALVHLPPEGQAAFLDRYGQNAGVEGYGGLLLEIAPPQTALVRADVATGESTVDVSGVPDLKPEWNLLNQNYHDLLAPVFGRYLLRNGGDPMKPRAIGLNEIGAAMQLEPNHVPQTDADQAALDDGSWPFYEGEQLKLLQPIVDRCAQLAGPGGGVTTLPVVFDSPELGVVQVPLFKVTRADGSLAGYVDNTGQRQYSSFEDWRSNNTLPPGRISYPTDGVLTANSCAAGEAELTTENTHAVVDTPLEQVVQLFDTATLVGGMVLGAAAIIGTGGVALPIAGAAMAGWSTLRGATALADRAQHGQAIDPFDASARAQWLRVASGVLGFSSLGSTALAQLVPAARALGPFGRLLGFGGQATDALGLANQGLGLAMGWKDLSTKDRMVLVSQMAFWGAGLPPGAGALENLYSARSTKRQLQMLAPNIPL